MQKWLANKVGICHFTILKYLHQVRQQATGTGFSSVPSILGDEKPVFVDSIWQLRKLGGTWFSRKVLLLWRCYKYYFTIKWKRISHICKLCDEVSNECNLYHCFSFFYTSADSNPTLGVGRQVWSWFLGYYLQRIHYAIKLAIISLIAYIIQVLELTFSADPQWTLVWFQISQFWDQ